VVAQKATYPLAFGGTLINCLAAFIGQPEHQHGQAVVGVDRRCLLREQDPSRGGEKRLKTKPVTNAVTNNPSKDSAVMSRLL
jgi:hypothetical protein